MQRARRFASVVAVSALTVSGLAACRSAPDVAVYFGQAAEIRVADVQRVYNDARDKIEAARDSAAARGQEAGASAAPEGPVTVPISGVDVVSTLVSQDIAKRVARQRNVTLPADLPYDQVAQTLGLPPDSTYVRAYTESRLLFNQLLQSTTPVKTTDADLKAVFDVFEGTGQMDPGLTFEQFRGQLQPQALEMLGRAVAVRNDVQAQLDQLNVRINPRYEPSEIAVYAEQGPDNKPLSLVSVPLADSDTAPVLDKS